MDELDTFSRYCLKINDYRLIIELNFSLPNVTDFVEDRIWECEDIFSFSIRFDRII